MAASSTLKSNSMIISYKVGVDSKGNDIVRSQRVKNITTTATDDNIVTLSDKVSVLLVQPVREIKKEQVFIITKNA